MLGKKNINIQKLLLIKGFDYISICFLGTEIYFKVFFWGRDKYRTEEQVGGKLKDMVKEG